jgi:hypothetical protein
VGWSENRWVFACSFGGWFRPSFSHTTTRTHRTHNQALGRRALEADPARATLSALSALAARLKSSSAARALLLAGQPPPAGGAGGLGAGVEGDDGNAGGHSAGLAAVTKRFRAETAAAYCVRAPAPEDGPGGIGGGAGGAGARVVGEGCAGEGSAIDSLVLPAQIARLFEHL